MSNAAINAFPKVAAAVAAIPAHGVEHPPSYEAALDTYTDEMLPALLPGTWRQSAGWLGHLAPPHLTTGLFDHCILYRMKGAPGTLTWKDTVALGMPYAKANQMSTLDPEWLEQAGLLNGLGVTVWIRPDLSAWYPGRTHLVIAAIGLRDQDATRWGFTVL